VGEDVRVDRLSVDDSVVVPEQDLVVAFGQGFLRGQGNVAEVAAQHGCRYALDRFRRGQLDRFGNGAHPGALVRLVHHGDQVVEVVEGGHAPALVPDQAADHAALIDVGVGSLEVPAAERDPTGLLVLDADLGVISLASLQCFLYFVSHGFSFLLSQMIRDLGMMVTLQPRCDPPGPAIHCNQAHYSARYHKGERSCRCRGMPRSALVPPGP